MDGHEITELTWAVEVLAKEKIYNQLTSAEKARLIQEAVDFGIHLAEKVREKIGPPDGVESIRQMLVSLGCGFRVDDAIDLPGPMSEYQEDLLAARFFTRRIRSRSLQAAERDEWQEDWHKLYEQCLTRELFHHVENTISGKASHHIRFKRKWLGILPVSQPVEGSRTIAALIFIKEFLGLEAIPLLMLYE